MKELINEKLLEINEDKLYHELINHYYKILENEERQNEELAKKLKDAINEKGKSSSGRTSNAHEFSFDRKNKQVTFYVDCGWEYINPWYILSKVYVAE